MGSKRKEAEHLIKSFIVKDFWGKFVSVSVYLFSFEMAENYILTNIIFIYFQFTLLTMHGCYLRKRIILSGIVKDTYSIISVWFYLLVKWESESVVCIYLQHS